MCVRVCVYAVDWCRTRQCKVNTHRCHPAQVPAPSIRHLHLSRFYLYTHIRHRQRDDSAGDQQSDRGGNADGQVSQRSGRVSNRAYCTQPCVCAYVRIMLSSFWGGRPPAASALLVRMADKVTHNRCEPVHGRTLFCLRYVVILSAHKRWHHRTHFWQFTQCGPMQ